MQIIVELSTAFVTQRVLYLHLIHSHLPKALHWFSHDAQGGSGHDKPSVCVWFSGLYHGLGRSGKESGVGLKASCPDGNPSHNYCLTITPPATVHSLTLHTAQSYHHMRTPHCSHHTWQSLHITRHTWYSTHHFPNDRHTALTGCRMLQGSCQAVPYSSSERGQDPPRGSESFQGAEIETILNCSTCRSSMAPTHVCTAPAVLWDLKGYSTAHWSNPVASGTSYPCCSL